MKTLQGAKANENNLYDLKKNHISFENPHPFLEFLERMTRWCQPKFPHLDPCLVSADSNNI